MKENILLDLIKIRLKKEVTKGKIYIIQQNTAKSIKETL